MIFIGHGMFSDFKYSFGQQLPNLQVIAKFQVNECGIFQPFEKCELQQPVL